MNEKKKWKICVLAGLLAALTAIGGVAAYFTDTDTSVTTFTVGKIAIDLQEPAWEEKEDADGNGIPDEAERMEPAQTIAKDPLVENIGTNDAFIFVTVETPYRNLITVNADGSKNQAKDVAVYSYEVNTNWVLLGTTYEKDVEDNYISEKKLYAYAKEDGACIPLKPNASTNTLFDTLTAANIVEGQMLESQTLEQTITAYGIQTSNLQVEGADAVSIWKIISNQSEVEDTYI